MENDPKTFADTQSMAAMDDHETQRLSNLTEQDIRMGHGLEKIAASLDMVRLEMQGIRTVLEALVSKR